MLTPPVLDLGPPAQGTLFTPPRTCTRRASPRDDVADPSVLRMVFHLVGLGLADEEARPPTAAQSPAAHCL